MRSREEALRVLGEVVHRAHDNVDALPGNELEPTGAVHVIDSWSVRPLPPDARPHGGNRTRYRSMSPSAIAARRARAERRATEARTANGEDSRPVLSLPRRPLPRDSDVRTPEHMGDNGVGPTTAPRPGRRRVQMLVAAAIGIAAVALVVVVATHSSSTSNGLTHANAAASPVVAPPVSVPPPTTVPTSTQPAALQAVPVDASTVAVAAPQNAVVTIATVAPCWIRVTDPTGATVLETTMAAGEQQTVPIGSGVEVRVGNASAAALTVNGGAVTTHHSGPDPYNVQFNVA